MAEQVGIVLLKCGGLSGAEVCKSCRSRKMLSNEHLLAKIGVDTAENEPLEVWVKIQFSIHFTPYRAQPGRTASSRKLLALTHQTSALTPALRSR